MFLERRQFGKRRIGVDRAFAFARRRAGCELPVRRPALGTLVATTAFFASAFLTSAAEFALVPVLIPVLALKAFARRTALVLARFANRRAIRCGNGFDRRIGAGFAEILVAVAPSAPMPLAPGAVIGHVRGGRRRRALLRTIVRAILRSVLMTMALAIMTRPALVRSAAGPPYLHHFRRRDSIGRSDSAGCSRVSGGFVGSLRRRHFPCLSFG